MKPYWKRVIHIAWKHKKNLDASYENMGVVIGPRIKISLNRNEEYKFEELKLKILEEYINDDNRHYIENSVIGLSSSDGKQFTKLTDNDDKECSF